MSVGRFCVRHVVTVDPSTSVEDAAARMTTRNVGALVVVDEHKPVGIAEDAPLEGAMDRMKFHRVRRLVVLDTDQQVVGIITLDDILELLAEERQALAAVTSVMRAVRQETL